jgi:hypothetical protein
LYVMYGTTVGPKFIHDARFNTDLQFFWVHTRSARHPRQRKKLVPLDFGSTVLLHPGSFYSAHLKYLLPLSSLLTPLLPLSPLSLLFTPSVSPDANVYMTNFYRSRSTLIYMRWVKAEDTDRPI